MSYRKIPNSNNLREKDNKSYFNEAEKSHLIEKQLQNKSKIILPSKSAKCKDCADFLALLDEKETIIKQLETQLNEELELKQRHREDYMSTKYIVLCSKGVKKAESAIEACKIADDFGEAKIFKQVSIKVVEE